MKSKMILMAAAVLMSFQALAINVDNKENVENLKQMLFAENAKPGSVINQQGKTQDGQDCLLTMGFSRYGVSLSLSAGNKNQVAFRLSTSVKTSSQLEIQDWDENYVIMNQVALSEDERGTYANKQSLNLSTLERPGETNINNVASVEISNQDASESSEGPMGQRIALTCIFSPNK